MAMHSGGLGGGCEAYRLRSPSRGAAGGAPRGIAGPRQEGSSQRLLRCMLVFHTVWKRLDPTEICVVLLTSRCAPLGVCAVCLCAFLGLPAVL